jgi:peptidoglycan/LPS O-acetylase OafA/YrhL
MERSNSVAALARGRDNNFNLLRAVAAALVIVTHAYGATGHAAEEPLVRLCGKSLGSVAVDVFFVVSGFLIAKSWDRSRGVLEFAIARALRIYPALWACVAFCVLVIGLGFTTLPAQEFLRDPATGTFVLRNLTVLPFGTLGRLPGVFVGHAEGTVNLPLWTLPFELKMYVLLALLGVSGVLRRPGAVALGVVAAALVYVVPTALGRPESGAILYGRFVFFFFSGTLAYLWRDRLTVAAGPAVACALAGLAALAGPFMLRAPLLALVTPYLVLAAALAPSPRLHAYNRLGDYSYGLYIYGFPVQQAVVALAGGADARQAPATNLALSLPVALALAVLSWHLLEARALAWRHVLGRPRRQPEAQVS